MYAVGLIAACFAAASAGVSAGPQTAPAAAPSGPTCRVVGRVTSGREPLPGVSIVVHTGDTLKAATSTDLDGRYTILFSPNATYRVTAELTAFGSVDRTITLGPAPCDTTADIELALRSRSEPLNPAATSNASAPAPQNTEAPASPTTPTPDQRAAAGTGESGGRGRGGAARGAGGRGAAGGARQGFQTLNVQPDANGEATLALTADDGADAARLLPSGFSLQDVQSDAVAIVGNSDATNLDRGQLNDRAQFLAQATAQGQFDPSTGQFAQGFNPGGFDGGGPGGQFGGGRGGGGRGGGGRGGDFFLGGRGARGQNPYQGTATYTFGGSALNTAPYQVNPAVAATQPQFAQNTFGTTFGGPLKIPGLYKDTNRRTNFQVNYTGNRSNNVFDQYATVPTQAMRNGDFSSAGVQLINPRTGQPFAGNQIPSSQFSASSAALLGYIPLPNLPGDQLNYHASAVSHSSSDSVSLRFTQNLSATVPQNGRGRGGFGGGGFGGRGGFGGGGGGGGGARGGQGQRGTNVVLQGQLQYRRNETESLNVFPGLGSQTVNQSITVPLSLNVVHNRFVNNFSINLTHSTTDTTNGFAGSTNVGAVAGINYPAGASLDPQYWGVPRLSFTGLTGVSGAPATSRSDTRLTATYTWSHSTQKHQLRMGTDVRVDRDASQLNVNAPGMFTFTGIYSTGGHPISLANGSTAASNAAFADFLLGMPQQATLQVGGTTELRGKSFDAYIEDNWQKSPRLTFNLGLRYELVMPYTDANGHLVNLDAAPGFTSVAPVLAGGSGLFSGVFPGGLLNADTNNFGPRIGVAFRPKRGTVIRGGYSITYNPNSYANIARRLASQPEPGFDVTETITGSLADPLSTENALLASTSPSTVMNNWGVARNYVLGLIQTWNASVSRDITPTWTALVGYTGTKGSNLDLLSAPDRGPDGTLLIPGVQPFTWESSTGRSLMNQGNFQLQHRLAHGFGGSASYTFSKAMDDTPSLGGGTIVGQDPRNPEAEWALSNFDRRHQFTGNLIVELPFGQGRRWLDNNGAVASVVGGWTATLAFTAQSGTPFSARVCGAVTDIAQGTNCSLRANVTGAPIAIGDPSIAEFFNNINAFTAPTFGGYGDSARNLIVGPAGHQLNGTLVRDVRLSGTRFMTLQINATNLLNTVQWQTIDTDINSPTFGHVLSVKPMRAVTMTMRFRF
jgi:hypothetical protein